MSQNELVIPIIGRTRAFVAQKGLRGLSRLVVGWVVMVMGGGMPFVVVTSGASCPRCDAVNVGTNDALPVGVELAEQGRSGQGPGRLVVGTQVIQVVVSPDPLDGTALLLLLEKSVSAEIRGLA